MRYRIITAGQDEYQEVRKFVNSTGSDLLQSGDLEELDQESIDRLFDERWTIIVIARESSTKKIIGTAMICFQQTWRSLIGHIEYVVVHEEYRGNRVGKGLMKYLLTEARSRNTVAVKLISEPHRKVARAMYTKMGYTLDPGSDRHFTINLE